MSFKAEITVSENADHIYRCLGTESAARERSSFRARKEGGSVIISVEAKDAVAFRAAINSVTQLLAVYQKTVQIGGKN